MAPRIDRLNYEIQANKKATASLMELYQSLHCKQEINDLLLNCKIFHSTFPFFWCKTGDVFISAGVHCVFLSPLD